MAENLAKRLSMKAFLLNGIPQLTQIEQSCQQVVEDINTRFQEMPRSQSCVHSLVPEGRTFCDYFNRCCISYCGRCEHFENRYLTKL